MKHVKRLLSCVSAGALVLSLIGCGAQTNDKENIRETEAESASAMTTVVETTAPVIHYEKQTVYLCTGYTTSQNDYSGSRGYEYDYDEYGRATRDALYFDGKLHGYSLYIYDDEAGTARREYYNGEGVLQSEGGASIDGPTIKIEGMPQFRHETYIYNEDGYVIEEVTDYGVCLYRREYNEDYTQMTEIGYPDDADKKFLSREATLDAYGNLLTETIYNEDGSVSITNVYHYDDQMRLVQKDYSTHGGMYPLSYPWIYEYDEHGNLVRFDLDYYYGYETIYTYEPFEIWVQVTGE